MKTTTMTLWTSLLVGAFGSVGFADSQKVIDVQTVQGWIAKKNANWQAKESWVTGLSKAEVKRMLGLQNPPKGKLEYRSRFFRRTVASALDWRNNNGTNWLGPVMNQGNCGSCVAFATVATLEAQTSISAGLPWLHPTYSPQAVFSCGGGGCDMGWDPDSAAGYLQSNGAPDEACMPYTSGSTGADVSCDQGCSDIDARSTKISGYTTPTAGDGSIDAVKAALKNGPLLTTLTVYADFLTYSSGVYKHVTGEAEGGHAVSIVGYDDSKNAWLVRNSWGPSWGENGFIWVSYDDESGIGSETWAFQLPTGAGQISVTSPSDLAYVSGLTTLNAETNGLSGASVQFNLRDSNGKSVSTIACVSSGGQNCSAQLDTTTLTEGRYEISAQASGSSTASSQIREFYVINSVPKLSISFVPKSGVNLNAPINGRPEFIITDTSTPVPMQKVMFRVMDQTGKIVSGSENDYVLPQMDMGWRTVNVPDGKYTILFHGELTYLGKVYSADSNSYTITVKN